MVNVLDRNMSL